MLLRKGVYMGSCEKSNKTALLPKKDFYSNLNLEDISYKDYTHAQKVWDVFKIKNLGEYHDLYVKSDTLLLADVFENFRNMCLSIHELDPIYFVFAPGLVWQAFLKKDQSKMRIINRL